MGSPPRLLYDDGTRRFACECGARMTEGGQAVEHALNRHQVAIEEKRNGEWRYALGTGEKQVMDMIIERMRMRGEDIPGFIRRLEELAEKARVRFEARVATEQN